MVSEKAIFYEINWTCYFIMLTLAKQITGYFNLKVNQRLFRFILTKIKFIGGRILDCVKIFIFVTKWKLWKIGNAQFWKQTSKEIFWSLNQINFHEALNETFSLGVKEYRWSNCLIINSSKKPFVLIHFRCWKTAT